MGQIINSLILMLLLLELTGNGGTAAVVGGKLTNSLIHLLILMLLLLQLTGNGGTAAVVGEGN